MAGLTGSKGDQIITLPFAIREELQRHGEVGGHEAATVAVIDRHLAIGGVQAEGLGRGHQSNVVCVASRETGTTSHGPKRSEEHTSELQSPC